MTEALIKLAKHSGWQEEFTFDTCKLNRQGYSEFLLNYMLGEKNGFVLNIDAQWGTGKTEFLKRLYVEAHNRNHPAIYIDAWESDFSKDPLLVVTSELINQLERYNEDIGGIEDWEKFKESSGKVLKGSLIAGASIASKFLIGDAGPGANIAQQLFSESDKSFTSKLASEYQEQLKAIEGIKSSLSQLSEVLAGSTYGLKLPVLVLVDELDRCRPTYAIEMLEVIKHFFRIDNFVFVVATDTPQMQESIKAVYGSNFDSPQYLKRFFDRAALLPTADFDTYLSHQNLHLDSYSEISIYPRPMARLPIFRVFSAIFESYDVSTRDVDQILSQLHACLRSLNASVSGKKVNLITLLVGIIERHKKLDSYTKRSNYDMTALVLKNSRLLNKIPQRSDQFKTYTLIEMALSSTCLFKEVQNEYRQASSYDVTFNPSQFRNKYQTDQSELQNIVCGEFVELLQQVRHQISLHLTWDDYKNCIDFAGYIN
ncbi:KAP family NTPase [Shewanella insulae]|uniref:KAP family P-loop NTPase fold protein n=1 Tax=Shewanella insulae TaxID=2681496 RepID=UPI001EFD64C8|nr:P-loop NTPase fold protein [Shewanella insulae]MCG9713331.1 KAP family NTPase [Shewanella insulae]